MQAVIFDLDDTLIDFISRKKVVIRESVKAMIKAGVDADFATLHADFSTFYWAHGIEDQQIFQKYLKKRYGTVDYTVLASAILAYRRVNNDLLQPYPGAKRLLQQLRRAGWKLALLSDAPKLEAYLRLCAVGFAEMFDVVLTFDDVGKRKPHHKGFKMVAKSLGVALGDCVMVGDRAECDIVGAEKLGMVTVHAAYGQTKTATADYRAESIAALGKILKKLR